MRIPVNQPYTISTPFGVPDSNAKFGRHAGLDFAVPTGRNVYAPISGTVTNYVWSEYHGHVVQIFDGKNFHRLMHNSQLLAKPWEKVTEGQLVAKSGSTGLSTGPHSHWDISPEKFPTKFSFIDPNSLLKGVTMSPQDKAHLALGRKADKYNWQERIEADKKLIEQLVKNHLTSSVFKENIRKLVK